MEPGAVLRIAPGTRVVFAGGAARRLEAERRAHPSWESALPDEACALFIKGALLALGEPKNPLVIAGRAWGGLQFLEASRGRVEHAVLGDCAVEALGARDESEVTARGASLQRCWIAAAAYQRARLRLTDCELNDAGRLGALCGREATLSLSRCRVRGPAAAVASLGGAVSLDGCELDCAGALAVDMRGRGHRLSSTAIRSARVGLFLSAGQAELRGVDARCSQDGVVLEAGAALDWSRGELECSGLGLVLAGGRVRADGLRVKGGRQALHVKDGRLEASRLTLAGQSEAAVWLSPSGQADLSDCSAAGGAAGVVSEGGRLRLSRCRFERHSRAALELRGPGHELNDTTVEGAAVGLTLSRGQARARGFAVRRAADGVVVGAEAILDWSEGGADGARVGLLVAGGRVNLSGCIVESAAAAVVSEGGTAALESSDVLGSNGVVLRSGARLDWDGGALSCSGLGLSVVGARARVRGVRLAGGRQGFHIADGDVEGRRLVFAGQEDGAVWIEGESTTLWIGCRVTETPGGIAARGGRTWAQGCRFRGCAHPLTAQGPARLLADPGPPGALQRWLRAPLLSFVLRTRSRPAFRRLYRWILSLAARRLRRRLAADPTVASAWLHRGSAADGWEPGVSDLDLAVSIRGLEGETGARRARRFYRSYDADRLLFPFLGEALVAEPSDHRAFLEHGGLRAAETLSGAQMLVGELPPSSPPQARWTPTAALGELAHAYTQLMIWWLARPRAPTAARRRHIAKAALDVLRYGRPPEEGRAPTRAQTLDSLRAKGGSAWAARLDALLAPALAEGADEDRAIAELLLPCLNALDQLARRLPEPQRSCAERVSAEPESVAEAQREIGRRLRGLDGSRRWLGGALAGAVLDDLYASALVLEDGALERLDALDLALWAQSWRQEPAAPGTPLLLTRSLWRAWQRVGYQENPLRGLELGEPGSGGCWLLAAGEAVPGRQLLRWGLEPSIPAPVDAFSLAQAQSSLACLGLQWRYMGCGAAARSTASTLHYAASRILGLRLLLERNVALPFFALDRLLARHRDEFPEAYRGVNRLDAPGAASRNGEFFEHYAFLDAQLRAAQAAAQRLARDQSSPSPT